MPSQSRRALRAILQRTDIATLPTSAAIQASAPERQSWWGLSIRLAWTMAFAVGATLAAVSTGSNAPVAPANAAPSGSLPAAPSWLLTSPQWLNTPALQADDLRGKVVLVNFWTYSCINSLRALPYVRAWADKYRDRGLVTVGVHTPEFSFEHDVNNVQQALRWYDLRYPVPTDNQQAIWRAFRNDGWPAFYLIGVDGRVRYRMLGEGDYDRTERMLQQLLSEASGSQVTDAIVDIVGQGAEAPAAGSEIYSPETYVGYAKASSFASPGGLVRNAVNLYRAAPTLHLNQWGLAGAWNVGPEFATSNASGSISFRFRSRDLHLVMGPSPQGQPVRFRVKLDGAPPGVNHGVDIDAEGWGTVSAPRLYQLIRQTQPVADRTIEIEFLDPGVRTYVFTFG